jgi:GDP-4-dehydro-6-deoxy-D-mannose reductase
VRDTILVTGASGFAGSHLVELLAARGPVTAWTRSAPPPELASLATWQRVDLLDRAAVDRGIRELQPAAVYHCAGSPHVAESWNDTTTPLSDNVMTTHHLLQALGRSARGARVLIPGSAHVYAPLPRPISESDPVRPASPYAVAKFAQEQLGRRAIAEDGVEVILTRSFNHTGARQTDQFVAPSFAKQIALIERGAGEPVIRVGNLEAQRDLTDVRDVVRAYVALMDKGPSGDIFNVASGAARPVRALLDGLIARARVPVRVEQDPARMRPSDIPVLAGDYSRLRSATGWSPRLSFDQMLDDLLAYWRQVQ